MSDPWKRGHLTSAVPHGTVGGYTNWKCRCRECKDAWSSYLRNYRQVRMARTGERILHGRFITD